MGQLTAPAVSPVPPAVQAEKLGQILRRKGFCAERDIEQALEVQRGYGGKLGGILLNLGALTEDQLLQALAEQLGLEYLTDLKGVELLPTEAPAELLRRHDVYPFRREDGWLSVLTDDPLNLEVFALLENLLGARVRPVLARQEGLKQLSLQLETAELSVERGRLDLDDEVDRLKELASEAPVIKLVNGLLGKAVELDASDIHFEALRGVMKVRLRIDGVLRLIDTIPPAVKLAVIARLKLISGMNIAENRLPQDGRISVRLAGKELDIRASSVPTRFGESFVLRLLGKEDIDYSLASLGFYPDQIATIEGVGDRPNGIFLTTGPTGSGKTTTLYAMLTRLATEEVKVITVEDPVEYEFKGISQINVRPEIGYTFANSLRSILRQDPDKIMVGEMRDRETVEIAIHAALTGHLVLSTLHTNSALASVTRLLDMGVEYFLLKASLVGLMAQRLVRQLCPHCRVSAPWPEADLGKHRLPELQARYPFVRPAPARAPGCARCGQGGYAGRLAIAEVVACDEAFFTRLDQERASHDLTRFGARSLLEDGLLKALEGRTSLAEVLKVAS